MNAYAKLALGLAGPRRVGAVVAYNLLPGNGMGLVGPPMATASPSVLPSPTPSSPATTPGADVWPVGPLGVTPHDVKLLGVPFSFTMPSPDWRSDRGDIGNITSRRESGTLDTGVFPQTSFAWFYFGGPNMWVNTDPCAGKRATYGRVRRSAEQAAASTTIEGTDGRRPHGCRRGWAARQVRRVHDPPGRTVCARVRVVREDTSRAGGQCCTRTASRARSGSGSSTLVARC